MGQIFEQRQSICEVDLWQFTMTLLSPRKPTWYPADGGLPFKASVVAGDWELL